MKPTRRHRVTLTFASDQGHQYLYDDETGSILPWNAAREAVLRALAAEELDERAGAIRRTHGDTATDDAIRIVTRWRTEYGAFFRSDDVLDEPTPTPEELSRQVPLATFELLLILTEDCNLRCTYCALSELYPMNRVRSPKRMSLETARRAIDWYARLVEPQIARNPQKRFGLSFYGGDPMMNMSVLSGTLDYVAESYPAMFLPVMTTNGTLLTPKNVEVLVAHGVQLAISIDGPPEEHDRRRVDVKNRGTYARILDNLRYIKRTYPEYFAAKLTSVSVYDPKTDIEAVEQFFAENSDIIPRSVFVNQVAWRNTDYYDQFTDTDMARFASRMERLRKKYKDAKVADEPIGSYLESIAGMPIAMGLLRNRITDRRPGFLPFTGSCLPGDKIAVHVDGRLDMCERVNGTYPIGHLDRGGIDFVELHRIIERYREQVMTACAKCPATKHCNVCPALVETDGDFEKVPRLCASTVQGARQRLADYVSILERNPNADFKFETDTSKLEERRLLLY